MKSISIFLLTGMVWMCGSCAKTEEPEVFTHVHSATIKVTVSVGQGGLNGQYTYAPLSGVTVDLYETDEDRTNGTELVFSRITDAGGLVVFENLGKSYYYLSVSHPSYGTMLEETSTPDGTVSFVQVYY